MKIVHKEYWAIYLFDYSGPISSRFGKDELNLRILAIVKGTAEDAAKIARRYLTMKTFGRTIEWKKIENGLIKC